MAETTAPEAQEAASKTNGEAEEEAAPEATGEPASDEPSDDEPSDDEPSDDEPSDDEEQTLDDEEQAPDDHGEDERTRSPLLQAIGQPISDDAPTGEKVTYDDDFQELKTQINSLESATGEIDYEEIVELGERILTEKSKDLTTACYLALGLARQRGFAGVAEGIGAAYVLVDTYWEDLYPALRRMAGRRNALQFLADRLKTWLRNCDDPTEANRESLLHAQEDLAALQAFCMEEMEEHAPAFSGISSALDKVVDKLPEPKSEEEEEETQAPAPQAAPGALQSASEAKTAVTRAATFLREQENEPDPMPYRLLRVLRWDILQDEPPSENGQTRLDPPLEQRRTYLSGLLDKGEHDTLVEEAEASFQNSPFHFWLDLQRLLAGALEARGDAWAPVREAVLAETALLVHRLPNLPSLAFSDGTPFADPLTHDWIDTQVRPLMSNGEAAAGAASAAEDDDHPGLQDQYRAARQELGSGNLQNALMTMREGAARDASPKARFRRRLYVADLCVKGQKPAVARPILEDLADGVAQHALDAWDPPLALEVWSKLHTCYKTLVRSAPKSQKQTFNQKAQAIFEKICQVDASHALSMGGS